MRRDPIPTVETYRGVGLHDEQDAERLEAVRADIDAAFALGDNVPALSEWAADRSHAPESRLLAAALALAEYDLAADQRRVRPDLDRAWLGAVTAGLGTTRSALYYDSIFSPVGYAGRRAGPGVPVPRDRPLRPSAG